MILTLRSRGAVLSQLPNEALVTSVVATRHYGVRATSQYVDEDVGQETWFDESRGHYRVTRVKIYLILLPIRNSPNLILSR